MLKTENDSIRDMKKHEITAGILALDPTMNATYAHQLAGKWQRAAQRKDLGFYEALRISGIITDTTPRDAIRNLEGVAA